MVCILLVQCFCFLLYGYYSNHFNTYIVSISMRSQHGSSLTQANRSLIISVYTRREYFYFSFTTFPFWEKNLGHSIHVLFYLRHEYTTAKMISIYFIESENGKNIVELGWKEKWNIRNLWVTSQQVSKIHPLFSVLNSLCFGSKRILICLLLVFSHITGAFRCRSHVCIFCQSILWPLCDMIIYDHSCTVLLFHSLKTPVSVEPQQMWWGTQSVQFANSLKQQFSLIWPTLKYFSMDMVNVWSRTASV